MEWDNVSQLSIISIKLRTSHDIELYRILIYLNSMAFIEFLLSLN